MPTVAVTNAVRAKTLCADLLNSGFKNLLRSCENRAEHPLMVVMPMKMMDVRPVTINIYRL